MEVRELLSSYNFPGDDIPIVKGSAKVAIDGGDPVLGENSILELMTQVDAYIPQPERPVDLPFLMPVEDVFSISGRGTVVTGRIQRPDTDPVPGLMPSYMPGSGFRSGSESWIRDARIRTTTKYQIVNTS